MAKVLIRTVEPLMMMIFLSEVLRSAISDCVSVHVSLAYVRTGLASVVYSLQLVSRVRRRETRKFTMFNFSYALCISFVGGTRDYILPWKGFAGRKRLENATVGQGSPTFLGWEGLGRHISSKRALYARTKKTVRIQKHYFLRLWGH
jgi:hypothetical protein